LFKSFDTFDFGNLDSDDEFDEWFAKEDAKYQTTGKMDFGEYADLRLLYIVDDEGNKTVIDDSRDDLVVKYSHIVENLVDTYKLGYLVFYSHNSHSVEFMIRLLTALKFCAGIDTYDVELAQKFANTKYVMTTHDTESG
jgi:hypothetical protein